MSEASESARVAILVADYLTQGLGGKLTIVGAGITIVNCDPNTGQSAPLSVVATVTFDPKFVGAAPEVQFTLETEDGVVFEVPRPGADPLPLRLAADNNPLGLTTLDGFHIPPDAVRPKLQMLMQFQTGLPLQPGQRYVWRITVDGETRDEWTEPLYVVKSG